MRQNHVMDCKGGPPGRPSIISLSVLTCLCRLTLLLIPLCGVLAPRPAQTQILPPAQEITLPSAARTGNPILDRIWVRYFSAPTGLQPAPGVILIPPVGSDERDDLMRRFAEYLARQGIACAIICLPYHGNRRTGRELPSAHFAAGTVADAERAYSQSTGDVSAVTTWLAAQPGVDSSRLGVVGVSLGAIVAHLAMGQDARLRAGVAALGGGDLPDLYHHSLVALYHELHHRQRLTADALAPMRAVDPLTYADRNRPRRVLMIQAARDLLVPPHNAVVLWRALSEPPIQWLDADHFALTLTPVPAFHAAATYLWGVWRGLPDSAIRVPRAYAPTIKIGLMAQSGVGLSPAIQWQFLTLLSRPDHIALLHLDAGLTGRGLFAGLGLTLTPFIDIGLSPRLDGRAPRPYISFHVLY